MSGAVGYLAGLSAENIVASQYMRNGFGLSAQRWRGAGGEIDLIMNDGDTTVFVEVKKSRDFATAAARLSQRQIQRLCSSAEDYLAKSPGGMNSNARFDVALVNGQGAVEILENAIGQ